MPRMRPLGLAASFGLLLAAGCGASARGSVSTAPAPSASAPPASSDAALPPPAEAQEPIAASGWPVRKNFAQPPAGTQKTASGIASQIVRPGKGTVQPKPHDQVRVHYSGWTADGKMFDSSIERGEPATFGVSQVVPGWTEVLQLMVAGERRRVWIPAALAYGDPPKHPGAPAGDLTFDIELLDVIEMPAPPPAPEDVKEPPKEAKRTKSGLAYRVLTEGTGARPKKTDVVVVHYSGWTTDGQLFDSSITRGQTAEFPLDKVIKGWTEGVQLMKIGEKTRFWIPANLAYGDEPRPGAPRGMLVFDIELIGIQQQQ